MILEIENLYNLATYGVMQYSAEHNIHFGLFYRTQRLHMIAVSKHPIRNRMRFPTVSQTNGVIIKLLNKNWNMPL